MIHQEKNVPLSEEQSTEWGSGGSGVSLKEVPSEESEWDPEISPNKVSKSEEPNVMSYLDTESSSVEPSVMSPPTSTVGTLRRVKSRAHFNLKCSHQLSQSQHIQSLPMKCQGPRIQI
ncbi:hypothetical protein OS493_034765 [Desmophyllum pertusum]|uniref:Uncharacterized protein n=1 Tax=Desmophyllum pertusum TaxID=174260 RepID=A0A9X0CNA3_9CNID|nr:hypothetical protein OS493_034765 [Desmophyllum pertusum]